MLGNCCTVEVHPQPTQISFKLTIEKKFFQYHNSSESRKSECPKSVVASGCFFPVQNEHNGAFLVKMAL